MATYHRMSRLPLLPASLSRRLGKSGNACLHEAEGGKEQMRSSPSVCTPRAGALSKRGEEKMAEGCMKNLGMKQRPTGRECQGVPEFERATNAEAPGPSGGRGTRREARAQAFTSAKRDTKGPARCEGGRCNDGGREEARRPWFDGIKHWQHLDRFDAAVIPPLPRGIKSPTADRHLASSTKCRAPGSVRRWQLINIRIRPYSALRIQASDEIPRKQHTLIESDSSHASEASFVGIEINWELRHKPPAGERKMYWYNLWRATRTPKKTGSTENGASPDQTEFRGKCGSRYMPGFRQAAIEIKRGKGAIWNATLYRQKECHMLVWTVSWDWRHVFAVEEEIWDNRSEMPDSEPPQQAIHGEFSPDQKGLPPVTDAEMSDPSNYWKVIFGMQFAVILTLGALQLRDRFY
ncbi:hypothetical protein B0H17DRAFT_1135432 [Mycena rosella]|uniref:Uncharacterized protein n=1 Tax=Mycena rosella TaxID=1033263 RepID=A0AAD7DDB9_MYCRO|nr:hypothetical protein B0H17DRAFT_1135432 [Mycena rosella]